MLANNKIIIISMITKLNGLLCCELQLYQLVAPFQEVRCKPNSPYDEVYNAFTFLFVASTQWLHGGKGGQYSHTQVSLSINQSPWAGRVYYMYTHSPMYQPRPPPHHHQQLERRVLWIRRMHHYYYHYCIGVLLLIIHFNLSFLLSSAVSSC